MRDIERFQISGEVYTTPFLNGEWVRYADHLMETTRLTGQNSKYWAEVERLKNAIDHLTSERNEAQAEVERLIVERDEIHAEVQRLTQILNGRRATADRVTAERDEARAEVERLKEQVGALTLAVEQADEMKAHAEAAAAREEAETDRVVADGNRALAEVERLKNAIDHLTSERDEAQADVEQLTQNRDAWKKDYQGMKQERDDAWDLGEELNRELEGQKVANQRLLRECAEDIASAKAREEAATTELNDTREKLARVQVQYDEFAKVTAKVIDQHQRERDHARQQVYLLREAGADRPSDETIWREAFISQLRDRYWAASEVADLALAEYRKRWPR